MIAESEYDLNRSLFGADSQPGEFSWVLIGRGGKVLSVERETIDFDPLDPHTTELIAALIGQSRGARSVALGYFVRSVVDVIVAQGDQARGVIEKLTIESGLSVLGFFISDRQVWGTTAGGSLLQLEDLNRHGRLLARIVPWRP